MRAASLLCALLFCCNVSANTLSFEEDGWYSWQVDSSAANLITVRIVDGALADLFLRDYHCWQKPRVEAVFVGTVSAAENFAWFRQFVENTALADNIREDALLGIIQSDSDEVYAYLDGILHDNS